MSEPIDRNCAVSKQELISAADLLDQGSSVQLPSYNYAKSKLVSNGLMSDSSYWTYLVSSSFSGICVVILGFALHGNRPAFRA